MILSFDKDTGQPHLVDCHVLSEEKYAVKGQDVQECHFQVGTMVELVFRGHRSEDRGKEECDVAVRV